MKKISIYVHIPFCISKCYYCDFASKGNANREDHHKYLKALQKELKSKKEYVKNFEIDTIYIGGGTPTILDAENLKYLFSILKKNFNIKEDVEYTIEANPETITREKLEIMKDYKINRMSFGLQTTNNKMLEEIGRVHTYEKFKDSYFMAREYVNNINIDLMFSLPNEKMEGLEKDIYEFLKLSPEHISTYSLIVEEGTKISKMNIVQDEDLDRNMYEYVKKALKSNGYKHYEISNFAKEGKESRHNNNYWLQNEYLGFGLAAHSYFDNVRCSNTYNINEYLNGDFAKRECEAIGEKEKIEEFMFLGLRMLDGVSKADFENKFNENIMDIYENEIIKLSEEKLIVCDGDKIKLTDKGIDLSNYVFGAFIK